MGTCLIRNQIIDSGTLTDSSSVAQEPILFYTHGKAPCMLVVLYNVIINYYCIYLLLFLQGGALVWFT